VAILSSLSAASFWSSLFLNGNLIGSSNVSEYNGPVEQYSPFTLQSTLNLKKGDRLWVEIGGTISYLYDDYPDYPYTHFSGFMLEEEIVASL
jgi:hypothetical protein